MSARYSGLGRLELPGEFLWLLLEAADQSARQIATTPVWGCGGRLPQAAALQKP